MGASERLVPPPSRDHVVDLGPNDTPWPLLICVPGTFRVLQSGRPVPVHGGKTEALLCHLALHYTDGVPCATLLHTLWPVSDTALAREALYSRVRGLHMRLGAAMGGRAPVLLVDGCYRLNSAAGVGVDMACFDALATAGDREARAGHVCACESSGSAWSGCVWNATSATRRAEHAYPQ